MKTRNLLLSVFIGLIPLGIQAQTTVLAKPVSDSVGRLSFQITQIVRLEGEWKHPIEVGQIIYPRVSQKAFPLSRFGEKALIAFPEPGNSGNWQGVHVHNGYIPAMNGIALDTLIQKIEKRPLPKETESGVVQKNTERLGECPICHQIHLHI